MTEYEYAEIFECQNSLFEFVQSVNREYKYIWYHKYIADKVQAVIEGRIKKLMLFIPPQHQKSTIASRVAPAWAFGKNYNLRVIHCAYGLDLVEGFSRDIQRIIDSDFYHKVFPETCLNGSNIRTVSQKNFIRTVEKWEIVGHKGSYFCAGVGGGISGKPCDIGIIDDPIKGAQDANSETIRNRIWEWYLQDFRSRLHNDSRQIIIQTRWHSDDLSGRILEIENDWEVISIPAIKEDNSNPDDIRNIGEALHPELHSVDRLEEMRKLSPRSFAALYQQGPTIEGGNIVKSEWFKYIDRSKINPFNVVFFADTAYTAKTSNDPSAIIATYYDNHNIYILNAVSIRLEFPELCKFINKWCLENGYAYGSKIYIEPKANGLSIIQQLKQDTGLNVLAGNKPETDKTTRLNVAAPSIEAGKIVLVNGDWNVDFVDEICGFPAKKHDEFVDLISYACEYHLNNTPLIIW